MDLHKVASKDCREILTSSAWNALIHPPVNEEDESEELPSTVDMDAIKGAPSTPLTAPSTPWSSTDQGNVKAEESEESSSDDEDDDSDGSTRSSSESGSEESGSDSCSWSTSSSSRSSSTSSQTRSTQSTPGKQTFSVSKSDVDQGGLKMKISALKVSSSEQSNDSSRRTRTESESSAASTIKPTQRIIEPVKPKSKLNTVRKKVWQKPETPVRQPDSKRLEKKPMVRKVTEQPNPETPSKEVSPKKVEAKSASQSKPKSVSPKKKISEATRLRFVRKRPSGAAAAAAATPVQGNAVANSSLRLNRAPLSHSSHSDTTSSESSESDEGDSSQDAVAQISQLAQQLGRIGSQENPGSETTEPLPTMSEHLQVINQEDLAAILPDVVTTETSGFDGFEDVSSELGKTDKKDTVAQDSSSDVELPEQIVSDAIKRIHVDSEDVDNSDNDKDAVKITPPKTLDRRAADSGSSSGDESEPSPVYSSSLLQQFVEKTEILSAQCERLVAPSHPRKPATISDSRVKKSKSLKVAAKNGRKVPEAGIAMPELESYPLDCSSSNVSPDSGIQSVPGSPVNERNNVDPTPPVLRPVTPPEKSVKKRRGRPKKTSAPQKLSVPSKQPASPSGLNHALGRRGPGRPKKAPPILEPNEPLTRSSESNLSFVLSEICERVNRRIESPGEASGSIELKDLERILNDHKSREARNSKIDAIFSKSKKLSIPNIAIVKPMQHHILNERNDEDDKQTKRGGKKNKEKVDENATKKFEGKIHGNSSETDPISRDKRRNEKRWLSKGGSLKGGRSPRGRRRHLSSSTEASCDKSVDSDSKKVELPLAKADRPLKDSKKNSPTILPNPSFGIKTSVSFVQPVPVLHKKKPKVLGLHHSLSHHKHKKKKRKKLKRQDAKQNEQDHSDKELEKIISEFQRISIDSKKIAPTVPITPTPKHPSSPHVSKQMPSEPKGKRTLKKRKGSERSRGSDKESGAEKSKQSDRESSTEDLVKDKPKRKQKKSQDVVKDSSEASPNEQRLPLKKRQYHVTPASQMGEHVNGSKEDVNERFRDTVVVKKEQDRSREGSLKKEWSKEGRVLRSSLEDTVEPSRERSISPAALSGSLDAGQRTVIVTPKKRHRVDDNVKEEKTVKMRDNKSMNGKPATVAKLVSHPVADKGGGKIGQEGIMKLAGSTSPRRRSGSRSSSLNKETVLDRSRDVKLDKAKRHSIKADGKKTTLKEKRQTRSAVKPPETLKLEPLQIDTKLAESTVAGGEKKPGNFPAAGIFEPSKEEVEIDNSILVPLNSPSELKNDLKGSLSVKKLKTLPMKTEEKLLKLDPKSINLTKCKEDDSSNKLVPLTTAEFILRKAEMKKKARRRKFINRTGFPTARKRKKTFKLLKEDKTADRSVITDNESTVDNNVAEIENSPCKKENIQISNDALPTLVPEIDDKTSFPDGDDDIPLGQILKTGTKTEGKQLTSLNLKRRLKKKLAPTAKKRKLEKTPIEKGQSDTLKDEKKSDSTGNAAIPLAKPARKRKCSSTIKNTKSKMQSRYQLPLLSMKKFKKMKMEEKLPSEDEIDVIEKKKKAQPRWKKKYLTAGLFSDYYKDEVPGPSQYVEKPLSKLVYKPEEHEHGLLPPPAYCEKFIRRRREDFKLPYDLWWLHANNQLPGREVVPSWNYRKIRTNVYYDVKPQTTGKNEAQSCNCKVPSSVKEMGCGDDCINRMVFSECSPQLCPCGDRCSNQRIQRHEVAPGLERFMTKEKGWGVRSTQPIKAGEFILEYVGEVVSEKEFKQRMQSRYVNDTHHYCLHLDGGLVIDGHRMGGDGRFVNHSCEPNCEMQKWTVNGHFRMALFALRNIPANQELSYDYNFSLYDPSEGQVCLCGAKSCRGVIGGKTQRVSQPGGALESIKPAPKDKKTGRGRKARARRRNEKTQVETTAVKASTKPMSHQQRCFAQEHHCFLLRNVEKVRRGRDVNKPKGNNAETRAPANELKPSEVIYTTLNALSTLRSMKTRRLAQAEDNPELAKVAKLAHVFKHLYNSIVTSKDEKGELLAVPFTTVPNKKKHPDYYTRVTNPIDLATIEQNINSGKYATIEAFDEDINKLFSNNVRFYGRTSELGIAATRLKRTYNIAKLDVVPQLEEIVGDTLPASFLPEKTDPGAEEEDVIRCICGMFKDEGVMIQCERCLVWQHCDCVKADESFEHYLCERCEPREVNYEILMEPPPEYAQEGQTHYVTLMRGTLQLRLGDTVYVLRDMLEESVSGNSPPRKVTYKTIKNVDYADLDIFRVERLWIDDKGAKFAFGHHYLRPHETYHEPSRKFFVNEVMRVPLYEVVPLDLIMQHCWVLDLSTYCKGRPVGAPEEHIYICEYRVDKSARLFHRIAKPYPICTKNYAFEKFETRLRPVRTYTPHGLAPSRRRARSNTRSTTGDEGRRADSDEELPLARVRDHAHAAKREMQKKRLNQILVNLLSRLPKQQPLDLTYLLEPVKRARTKSLVKKPSK